METKDYTLTCGEVIDNLLTLACAYEKASAGKAPNGFAFSPAEAAANMKAAVHFIGSFGQQTPRWISVEERLPEDGESVLVVFDGAGMTGSVGEATFVKRNGWFSTDRGCYGATHWMPLPEPPSEKGNDDA